MKPHLDLNQSSWRLMGQLAFPVFVEQLLILLVGLVDTWLAGQYLTGDAPLAAIGLVAYLLWLFSSLFGALSIGATALVARHVGAGDWESASCFANQALVLGGLFSLLITALMAAFAPYVAAGLGLQGEAAVLATQYLWFMVPTMPAVMVRAVGVAVLRGAGDTASGFMVMSTVNLVNAGLSAALVVGISPFPRLGWIGLAWGTAWGYVVGAMLVLLILRRGQRGIRLSATHVIPSFDPMRRLLRVGVPGGIDRLAIVLCHLWFVSIINRLGTLPAAAHSLAIRIEGFAYIPGTAFEVAAMTLAGQFLGRREPARAVTSVLACLAAMTLLMLATSLLFWCAPESLLALFTSRENRNVADAAAPLLRFVAWFLPCFGVAVVLSGALRGAGDTRSPLAITLFGFFLVRIPLAYYLAHESITIPWIAQTIHGMGWGVLGAWYAMAADIVVRAALTAWAFGYGAWRDTHV